MFYIIQGYMKKTLLLSLLLTISFMLSACGSPNDSPDDLADDLPKTHERTLFQCENCYAASELDGDWIPVWCDEFDGDTLDLSRWNYADATLPFDEVQYYSPNNIFIEDGKLIIEARKESFMDSEYTSGRINTKDKGDWLYGRIIVRAKMPPGIGTWAGIWMMTTDSVYGVWPNSGEIDIIEYVGFDQNRIHSTVHTGKYNWLKNTHTLYSMLLPSVEEVFVDYEMIWEPGSIKTFVNGEPLASFEYIPADNQNVEYHQAWPFDQKFYFILNLAIGGGWGGAQGIDDSIFPTRMEIDYVRFYQRDYPYLDRQIPKSIDTIYKGQVLKALIYWDVPEDDYFIDYYEIYIDDNLFGTSSVNSFFFAGLFPRTTYCLQVVAVDFAGNKSKPIDIEYSYG